MTCIYIPYIIFTFSLKPKTPDVVPLMITDAVTQQAGRLDPSIAYDPRNGQMWMAYTSQEGAVDARMNVRLAMGKADTGCKDWQGRLGGFEAKSDSILAPDGQTVLRSGVWRIETPSLVYDPGDSGKEWKLYAYKYFWSNDPKSIMPVARHYGVIVYKYAANPGDEWSTEQWLFSPAPGYPPPPYEQSILLHLNQLDPSLQDVTAYARPSVIYKDGALVMTLSAFTDSQTPDRVIMIVSLDHGNSWRFAGTVLQQSEVTALDPHARLAGATLVQQDGQVYLAAILGNAAQRGQGTFIFGFDDLSRGLLQHDPKTGAPVTLHYIPLPKEAAGTLGGGAAAYDDACKSGMLVTEEDGNSANFQIYRTKFKPIDNKQGEK